MPANLTPDYQKADQQYRDAVTPAEKLAALEEMLRTLPKHKGTEKMQAELKKKISAARETAVASKKGGSGKDPFHVPRQGAGQVLITGAPNVGKSAIVGALTKAPVKIAEFPFTTHEPLPGMAHHEDVPIQLVDTPPVTPEHIPPGYFGAIYAADIVAPVVKLSADTLLEDADFILNLIRERKYQLLSRAVLPAAPAAGSNEPIPKRGLLIATASDAPEASDNLALVRKMAPADLDILPISTVSGENLNTLMQRLFGLLHVLRVYAKPPGKPADKDAPFILPIGSTVMDLATHIHKDVAASFKHARVWGEGVFPGQQVHHDHVLHDKDVIEIHV
jgi:ribosome-interacting GTPase 1